MTQRSVVIVGAGPTGAALSFLLARRGIRVVLVEREPTFDRLFRGEALMPGGIDALRQMGLAADLDRLPQAVVPCMELFVEGRRVVRADWPEVSGENAARAISQPALIGLLVDKAAATGSFELRTGTTVQAIETTPAHVDVTVHSSAGAEILRADLVIGADGRSSTTRALAGIRLQREEFPEEVAWLSVPAPETQQHDPRFQSFNGRAGSLVLYPSWDGRVRVGLRLPRGGEPRRAGAMLDRVAAIAGEPYASIVRDRAREIPAPVIFKVLVGRVPQWSSDRVLLVGDAAHPMAPVRAQGINIALRDAIVAANHLVPALVDQAGLKARLYADDHPKAGLYADDHPKARLYTDDLQGHRYAAAEAIAAAARAIQAEREGEVEAIQRMQRAAMELPPPMRSPLLRSTVLPMLRAAGVLKRKMLESEIPMRHGTARVTLAV